MSSSDPAARAPDDADSAPTLNVPPPTGAVPPPTGAALGSQPRSGPSRLRGSTRRGLGPNDPGLGDDALFAGRYEVLQELARGGMGVVYKARHVHLGQVLALKVMLAGSYATDEDCRRFIREAEASARLKHPHIVAVHDIGEEDGQLFFTMDFVEGAPLSSRKKELGREKLLDVMIEVADAVSFAHQRGIIHRDLKPANIMMTVADEPRIMDFGLAKQVALTDEEGAPSLQTREGAIMGTPHYMPPEQADGSVSEVDVRSDVYALGVILFELWTGRLPFEGRTVQELLLKIFDRDPPQPRTIDPTIDPDMEAIILKAIEKQKTRRYETAADLKRDLERLREGLPVQARRAGFLYKAGKWLRRHRTAVVTSAVLAAVISAATAVIVQQRREAAMAGVLRAEQLRLDAAALRDAVRLVVPGLEEEARGVAPSDAEDLRERVKGPQTTVNTQLALIATQAGAETEREELEVLAGQLAAVSGAAERAIALGRALTEADAALADAREKQVAAVRALDEEARATLGADAGPRSLDETVVAHAKLLAEDPPDRPETAAFETVHAVLDKASTRAFTALELAGAREEERTLARRFVTEVAALRSDLEQAAREAARTRLSLRLLAAAEVTLGLLQAEPRDAALREPQRRVHLLKAASGARALVDRAVELAPAVVPAPARAHAEATFAEVLLDLALFEVFDAEVERVNDQAARDRLRARRDEATAKMLALKTALEGLGQVEAVAHVAAVDQRLADVAAICEQPLPDALQRVADESTARLRQKRALLLRDEVYAAVTAAVADARGADALERLDAVTRALSSARTRIEQNAELFDDPVLDQLRRGCDEAHADLLLQAVAQAQRASDAARVLERGREALQVLDRLLPARKDDRARLAAELAAVERLKGKPEGMELIAGGKLLREGGGEVVVAPFYLARHEVTNAAWARHLQERRAAPPPGWVVKDGAVHPPPGQEGLPVTGVTFEEASAFARASGHRLPTDDEWEVAARLHGDERTEYPWGSPFEKGKLQEVLQPPGSNRFDVTAEGIFDLGGNVSEWVTRADGSAAIRGASFLYPTRRVARGTHRMLPHEPGYAGPQLGLRLAKDAR